MGCMSSVDFGWGVKREGVFGEGVWGV